MSGEPALYLLVGWCDKNAADFSLRRRQYSDAELDEMDETDVLRERMCEQRDETFIHTRARTTRSSLPGICVSTELRLYPWNLE